MAAGELKGVAIVSGLSISTGVVGWAIGVARDSLARVSAGAIASVAGLSDALGDWGWRCIVIDSVISGNEEWLGLAGSVAVS